MESAIKLLDKSFNESQELAFKNLVIAFQNAQDAARILGLKSPSPLGSQQRLLLPSVSVKSDKTTSKAPANASQITNFELKSCKARSTGHLHPLAESLALEYSKFSARPSRRARSHLRRREPSSLPLKSATQPRHADGFVHVDFGASEPSSKDLDRSLLPAQAQRHGQVWLWESYLKTPPRNAVPLVFGEVSLDLADRYCHEDLHRALVIPRHKQPALPPRKPPCQSPSEQLLSYKSTPLGSHGFQKQPRRNSPLF
ncbi:hypothetical protein O181_008528 [Austropuccinia psidii MF-1]|uniref:Uncharacterized protein n=1 Tax=Austropuccinia psidii MF-1 TaxID=1389203 RepID=A0A9Q3BPB0_9BASI|nr:hypothetical protein [Austropuccinia psidii MF-1]